MLRHINYFCVFFCNKNGHILLIFFGKYRRTRQRWWIFWCSVPLVGCFQPFQGMSSWTMVKKMKMWKQHQQLANNSSMWPTWNGQKTTYTHFCDLLWVIHADLATCFPRIPGLVTSTWSWDGRHQLEHWRSADMDPWMAMRNESYGHLHRGKQAATMTSCRHTRCKRCCRSGFCSQWENQLSSSWTKTKWDLILSERVDSMTISRVVGGVKHPGSVGGLIADLQIDCSTLWKQLSYFARPPRICWNTLAEKRWVYSCGRGAFQRFVVNCLHSVHSDSMVADFSHKSPLQTENYSTFHADSVLAASCHSQEGISQYASTHFPLIFPRVIEMSIHSHHQCGVQHYGSFPLIHINPASQSTIEWGQQSFTKTGLLVSNLLASVPLSPTKADSTMTTMTGFGRPKVEPCRKLYFANVIVPTLNFHAVVGR